MNKNNKREVIIIDDDEPKSVGFTHKRRKTENQKRKVKVEATNNFETLVVTQKVKMKKQKIQCIINLTNICDHKKKQQKKSYHKHELKHSKELMKDRIIPNCFRNKCQSAIVSKICCRQKNERMHSEKTSKRKYNTTSSSKIHDKYRRIFSPVSSFEIAEESIEKEISYENISSDSMCSYDMDDLDTLIKRTKARERNIILNNQPINASTPIPSDSGIKISTPSEMDTSFHSMETMILSPKYDHNLYSPTIPTRSPTDTLEHKPYSPMIGCKEHNLPNLSMHPLFYINCEKEPKQYTAYTFSERNEKISQLPKATPKAISLKPRAIAPKPEAISPKSEAILPKPDAISPKPEAISPKPEAISSKPFVINKKNSSAVHIKIESISPANIEKCTCSKPQNIEMPCYLPFTHLISLSSYELTEDPMQNIYSNTDAKKSEEKLSSPISEIKQNFIKYQNENVNIKSGDHNTTPEEKKLIDNDYRC